MMGLLELSMIVGGALICGSILGLTFAVLGGKGWHREALRLGFQELSQDGCRLGAFRGRSAVVHRSAGNVCVEVRLRNRARLVDFLQAKEPLVNILWLSPLGRTQLDALAARCDDWSVEVSGRTLKLTGSSPFFLCPDRLIYLLDVTCDLAEGVDSIPYGGAPGRSISTWGMPSSS